MTANTSSKLPVMLQIKRKPLLTNRQSAFQFDDGPFALNRPFLAMPCDVAQRIFLGRGGSCMGWVCCECCMRTKTWAKLPFEAAHCGAHARRRLKQVFARDGMQIAVEALRRIGASHIETPIFCARRAEWLDVPAASQRKRPVPAAEICAASVAVGTKVSVASSIND